MIRAGSRTQVDSDRTGSGTQVDLGLNSVGSWWFMGLSQSDAGGDGGELPRVKPIRLIVDRRGPGSKTPLQLLTCTKYPRRDFLWGHPPRHRRAAENGEHKVDISGKNVC